jgi:rod shape-determining protein MreC
VEQSPPPFFRQGHSAHARLVFFALLSIILLVVDSRFKVLETLRQGVGTVLYPIQRALLMPRNAVSVGTQYTSDVARLRQENSELRQVEASNARALLQNEQLASENNQLRKLLEMRDQVRIKSTVAEVLYETRDSFSRKVVIDRGLQNDVYPGQPVIDARGVIGQVVRVNQYSSEVQLVTDPAALLPVEVQRSGQRAVAYGGPGAGMMELRFLAANSDIKDGDLIVTSGLDRIYPSGLPVGKVKRFERNASSSFSNALVEPLAAVERTKLVLVLLLERQALPAPPEEPVAKVKRGAKP